MLPHNNIEAGWSVSKIPLYERSVFLTALKAEIIDLSDPVPATATAVSIFLKKRIHQGIKEPLQVIPLLYSFIITEETVHYFALDIRINIVCVKLCKWP